MEQISSWASFGGELTVHEHASDVCQCPMTFAVYTPPQASLGPVPVLWYLSGLTCNWSNVMEKSGIQRAAAKHGLMIIAPDTSPRGDDVADDDAYDLGQGAGFYLTATRAPWSKHYRMDQYIVDELTTLVVEHFPADMRRQGITGHSMGGHGALTLAMRLPGRFRSVSAFAPIANPTASDWGRKQFTAYLGKDESTWAAHDSTLLMRRLGFDGPVLIDQGSKDQFLDLLKPEALAQAMMERRQQGIMRMQAGYDHSYFFVSTFMADHISFHAEALYQD